MPVLPEEPALFPDELLDANEHATVDGREWWVLHTKPRQEKSLARDLLNNGVPFYLPLIEHRTLLRGRVRSAWIPLFPSYLFLLAQPEERITALGTKRVVRNLVVAEQQRMWSDLHRIRRLIASGAPITPEERLVSGMTVEIISGPLAGLRGKILRIDSRRRFVVGVEFMKQGASVLLDDATLIREVTLAEDAARPERSLA